MLKEYDAQFKMLLAEKSVMQNTSLLFKLPQESYGRLDVVYEEYKCISSVYDMYVLQKNARDTWAKTLWSDLNPKWLLEGMDKFLKQYKQLPKSCRSTSTGSVLEANMKKFKSAIPLFIELKDSAMKDIHWQKLMDQTGTFKAGMYLFPSIVNIYNICLRFFILFKRSTF